MRKLVYNIYCYISIIWNLQQVCGVFQLYSFTYTRGSFYTVLFLRGFFQHTLLTFTRFI